MKPTAIILGPVERITHPWGDRYIPRVMGPAAEPRRADDRFKTAADAERYLDECEARHRADGYRIIRCKTMEQRDAILTYARESVERAIRITLNSFEVHGNECRPAGQA